MNDTPRLVSDEDLRVRDSAYGYDGIWLPQDMRENGWTPSFAILWISGDKLTVAVKRKGGYATSLLKSICDSFDL